MFPGQSCVPHMHQGSHMENNMLRPPGNFNTQLFDESSKKRKSMDQPGSRSGLTYEFNSPFGSNPPRGMFLGSQVKNQAYESQQRKATGPTNLMHQCANDQFHYQNRYSATNNMNFLPNGTQNLGNAPLPPPPPPPSPPLPKCSAYGGSFGSVNMQALEGVSRSVWQSQAHNMVGSLQNNQYLNNGGVKDVANHNSSFLRNGVQYGGLQQTNQFLDNEGVKDVANHNFSFQQNEVQYGGLQQNNQSLNGVKDVANYNPSSMQNGVPYLQQNNQSFGNGGVKDVSNHSSSYSQSGVQYGGLQQNNQSLIGDVKDVVNHNSSFPQNGVQYGGLQQNNQSLDHGGVKDVFNHNSSFQQHGVQYGGLQQSNQSLSGGVKDVANHNYSLPQNGVQYGGLQQNNQSLGNRGVKDVSNHNSSFQQNGVQCGGLQQKKQSLDNGGVENVANHNFSFQQNGVNRYCGVPSGDIFESKGQGIGSESVRATMKLEESHVKNSNCILPEICTTPKSVETSHQKDSIRLSSVDKDKVASTAAEKLWEGSLQLSSTVTVPSVAFFKSGEKLLNTNWYKSVEVKGKVRLEAFEKYIEDLPCSHNKGLMVISLCLKEGSSETELKSMKEVARGYTKTSRVGFAHLAREIHFYICPRSDAIITILAKYGFFKGMAAIEDKQDSMIGCVIWRKSRIPPSISVAKEPDAKCKAPSSDEDSDLEDSDLMQLVQEIVAPLSATFTSTVDGDGENGGNDSKNIPSKTQVIVSDTLKPGISNSGSHQVAQGGLTLVKDQPINHLALATEQPKQTFSFQNTIIPSPKIVKEKRSSDDDDDDLPEFNFITASKPSLSNVSKPQEKETIGTIQNANPLLIPAFTHLEKRDGVQNQTANSSISNPVISPRKNFFDDDEMPEWCPPEKKTRSLAVTIRPHTIPSALPVSDFQNSRGPSISPQGYPHVGHFHTPQPRPFQKGPGFESVSNSNSNLGTPPNFHDNKQGWGPRRPG